MKLNNIPYGESIFKDMLELKQENHIKCVDEIINEFANKLRLHFNRELHNYRYFNITRKRKIQNVEYLFNVTRDGNYLHFSLDDVDKCACFSVKINLAIQENYILIKNYRKINKNILLVYINDLEDYFVIADLKIKEQ